MDKDTDLDVATELRAEDARHLAGAIRLLELEIDLAQTVSEAPVEEVPDPVALGREVEELRAKLSGFGAVNVVALDQLTELEEREKYMLAQTEDLSKSKGHKSQEQWPR